MSDAFIFEAGVICFGLTVIGVILTVYEFKKISRASVKPVAPAKPLPLAVEFVEPRSRAS